MRDFLKEHETLIRTGVATNRLRELVSGQASDQLNDLIGVIVDKQRRYVGGRVEIGWIRSVTDDAEPGDRFVASVCTDTSSTKIYEHGVLAGPGRAEEQHFHLQAVEGELRLVNAARRVVPTC